jgi:phosphoribosylaminoimidazole (AIR) synthetase
MKEKNMSTKKTIKSAFESMLFVWGEPLPAKTAAEVFDIPWQEAYGYFKELQDEYDKQERGILHITGGGFFENIPRIMPKGLGVSIKTDSWERPLIFKYIESKGNIEEKEMFSTFNMGVGMMMVVKPEIAQEVVEILSQAGEKAFIIGEVVKGEGVALV